MKREELIRWIAVRGCVTAGEVAEVAGVSIHTARLRLRKLKRRGLLKIVWGRGVAWWCVPDAKPPVASLRVIPGTRRRQKTKDTMQKAEEVMRGGCVTTAALMRMFGLSHTHVFYALRLLQAQGRAVEAMVGKVAMWCRDRETAVRFLEEVRETIIHLVEQHRLRYVRPKQLFELIVRDRGARELFSRLINVKAPPSASAFSVLVALLDAIYGDPVNRSVYYTAQPRDGINIEIRDGEVTSEYVPVKLPPALAEALSGADVEETVLHALEQLLQKFKT